MPRIRFRLRTIMIAIAALAVPMGLAVALLRLVARTDALFVLALATTVVLVVNVLLALFVSAVYLWRGLTRRRAFSMTSNPACRRLRGWLFIGGRLVLGLLIILAVFSTWRNYQQLGLYSLPAFLIIAAVLALLIRSLIRTTAVETGVVFAIILVLDLLLVPAVHVHSERNAYNVRRSAVNT